MVAKRRTSGNRLLPLPLNARPRVPPHPLNARLVRASRSRARPTLIAKLGVNRAWVGVWVGVCVGVGGLVSNLTGVRFSVGVGISWCC